MELPNADEAVTIVKAVVQSYLTQNIEYSRGANRDLTESLKQQLTKISEDITETRKKLKRLYKKGKVAVLKPEERLNTTKDADVNQPTFKSYSENHVERMMDEMVQTDLQLIAEQSMLEVKRDAYKARLEASQQAMQEGKEQQHARVREEFKKDPEVLALKQEIDKMREHLDRIKHNVRQPHDPARAAAQKQFDKLKEEYQDLWEDKYPEIKERLSGPRPETQSRSHVSKSWSRRSMR